jgi:hypothetical protein
MKGLRPRSKFAAHEKEKHIVIRLRKKYHLEFMGRNMDLVIIYFNTAKITTLEARKRLEDALRHEVRTISLFLVSSLLPHVANFNLN